MKILEIRCWKFSSLSPVQGKERAKASSEDEAGSLSSLGSIEGCVRPGEMSDKLLGWSGKSVFLAFHTPRERIVQWCHQEIRHDLCLKRNRIGASKA